MNTDVLAWLTNALDDVEREARAADEAAPAPWTVEQWRDQQGCTFDTANVRASAPDGHPLAVRDGYLWDDEGSTTLQAPLAAVVHVVAWDPAVVLAAAETDRAILAEHAQVPGEWEYNGRPAADPSDPRGCRVCHDHDGIIIADGPCRTVLLVASRYKHRTGWRPKWTQSS